MIKFIQKNFSTFAAGSLILSVGAGVWCLDYIQNQQKEKQPSLQSAASVLDDKSSRVKSRDELRLQAMVENALKSSWKENLDNAYQAQERFMLPGRDHGKDPQFLRKIDRRVKELMNKQKCREEKNHETVKEAEREHEMKEDKIQYWK
jgi:hypothetical protein